jgi:alpha/beta superfamily hydrolase
MTRVAIVSHGMGARMVNDFLARRPDTRLIAWVPLGISSGRFDSLSGVRFPILDIYAEKDIDVVLQGAADRARLLRGLKGSRQAMVYNADHNFARKEREVAALIDQLLTPLARK